ncbi:hypothetical protein CUJ86_02945 [Methanofollis fontis]|uniref:Uncharacterized protein n=1 Tax=Methanofollis fontis TaxID=2052832 RepID=A0A483CS60_9EURY|nr:hypothetical protein CUJ86_02945 [Methanofollis fontis]
MRDRLIYHYSGVGMRIIRGTARIGPPPDQRISDPHPEARPIGRSGKKNRNVYPLKTREKTP